MKFFLSGNEAVAFGLLETKVRFISGYPGTPSSEIIPTAIKLKKQYNLKGYFEWSVNEKTATEEAVAASFANLNSAVVFKQVGLNVAMDPFMNAAITGTVGSLVIISADDPGPHSSQTEQDSRFLAFFAKIPVFDPSTPQEAYEMAKCAVNFSKENELPVMLRTTTRISHSRKDIEINTDGFKNDLDIDFKKNQDRFAATPHFRYLLHKNLNQKIDKISQNNTPKMFFNGKTLIITSGVSFAYLYDLVIRYKLENKITLAKFDMPYPVNQDNLQKTVDTYSDTIVIEESYPLIEMQIKNRTSVKGRLDKTVPNEGELTIDTIKNILIETKILNTEKSDIVKPPFKKPSLCPGCGHRSAFFAIKNVFKDDAIYTGDIGCYTLGINLNAVDTVHCMGASVSFAFGFDKAYSLANKKKPIVATIGDSTFFHSGITPLIDAVHNKASFLLVILDNSTVAMTGNQKTPSDSEDSFDNPANSIRIEDIVKALKIKFFKTEDAYNLESSEKILKMAKKFIETNNEPAVIILKHPCVYTKEGLSKNIHFNNVFVDEKLCKGCRICIEKFECPALVFDDTKNVVKIDAATCINCGQCVKSCPFNAIRIEK